MVNIESYIISKLEKSESFTLQELGGASNLIKKKDSLVNSCILPELIEKICTEWIDNNDKALFKEFILFILTNINNKTIFVDILDIITECPDIIQESGLDIFKCLLNRFEDRVDETKSYIAANAISYALKIYWVNNYTNRYDILGKLTSISTDDSSYFASKISRLIGLCYEQWKDQELKDTLHKVINIKGSESDGAFELGMACLLDAFEKTNDTDLYNTLRESRQWLARSENAEEERTDASLYGLVLDILLNINLWSENQLQTTFEKLEKVATLRQFWLKGMNESWLTPRYTTETEWLSLIQRIKYIFIELDKTAFYRADLILDKFLETFKIARSYYLRGQKVDVLRIIEPQIHTEFIKNEAHIANLEYWLNSDDIKQEYEDEARNLLHLIRKPKKKESSNEFSKLEELIGPIDSNSLKDEELLNKLELRLKNKEAAKVFSHNPILEKLYKQVLENLQSCPDYHGEVKGYFDEIILLTLKFLFTRYDYEKSFGTHYLFNPDAVEQDLGKDYIDYLTSTELFGVIKPEVRYIASGRADVLFSLPKCHFVAEFKARKERYF